MTAKTVLIVRETTKLADADVAKALPSWQTQVSRDLAPIWNVDATLRAGPLNSATPDDMVLALLDNSDQEGALGYHDLGPQGQPMAKVFVADDMANGYNWTITTSHELLEMLVDPTINMKAATADAQRDYIVEVCDPCEADGCGYVIDGTVVSDFVFPAWYDMPGQQRYDYQGLIAAPFTILPGGYAAYFDLKSLQWVQATNFRAARNSESAYRSKSRFERLQRPRKEWARTKPPAP